MGASHGRVDRHDIDTDSVAFVVVDVTESLVRLGFGIEADGDLDLVLGHDDARRLTRTLLESTGRIAYECRSRD
jgi:hypothetical protein